MMSERDIAIQELNKILLNTLRDNKTSVPFGDYCREYARSMVDNDLYFDDDLGMWLTCADSDTDIEISKFDTKSGNPEVIDLYMLEGD